MEQRLIDVSKEEAAAADRRRKLIVRVLERLGWAVELQGERHVGQGFTGRVAGNVTIVCTRGNAGEGELNSISLNGESSEKTNAEDRKSQR